MKDRLAWIWPWVCSLFIWSVLSMGPLSALASSELNAQAAEDLFILLNPYYQALTKKIQDDTQQLVMIEAQLNSESKVKLGEQKEYWDRLASDLQDPDANLSSYFQANTPLGDKNTQLEQAEKAALIILAQEKALELEQQMQQQGQNRESLQIAQAHLLQTLPELKISLQEFIAGQRLIYQGMQATQSMEIMKSLFVHAEFTPDLTCSFFTQSALPLAAETGAETESTAQQVSSIIPAFCASASVAQYLHPAVQTPGVGPSLSMQAYSAAPNMSGYPGMGMGMGMSAGMGMSSPNASMLTPNPINPLLSELAKSYQGKSYQDIPASDLFLIYLDSIIYYQSSSTAQLELQKEQLLKDIKLLVLQNEARLAHIGAIDLAQIQKSCLDHQGPGLNQLWPELNYGPLPDSLMRACDLSAKNPQEYLPYLSLPLMTMAILSNQAYRGSGLTTAALFCSFYSSAQSFIPESKKYHFEDDLLKELVPNTPAPVLPYDLQARDMEFLNWLSYQNGLNVLNSTFLKDPSQTTSSYYGYSNSLNNWSSLPAEEMVQLASEVSDKLPLYQGPALFCELAQDTLFGLPLKSMQAGSVISNTYYRQAQAATPELMGVMQYPNCQKPSSIIIVQTLQAHQLQVTQFSGMGMMGMMGGSIPVLISPGKQYKFEKEEIKNNQRYIYLTEIHQTSAKQEK